MTPLFRALATFLALVLSLASAVRVPTAPPVIADEPTPDASITVEDPGDLADRELIEALTQADLFEDWMDRTERSSTAAVLRVSAGAEYDQLRSDTITALAEVESLRLAVGELGAETAMHEDRLADRLRQLNDATDALFADDANAIAATEELADASALLATHLERLAAADADLATLMSTLSDSFGRLHRMRSTSISPVDELPLVTLDAYLRGEASVATGCTVDWTLLAGIGRIESRHGTLGDASVDASGNARPNIYGPLLDGGATERDAIAAAAAAEAAEEAAQLAAEVEAAEAEALAEERRNRELFGVEPTPTATPVPEPSQEERLLQSIRELRSGAADGESEAESGDDDADTENEGSAEDEGSDEDEGNGFAVIADTDNGRLDGNSSWDRAVGPMQFIPGTWQLFGVDGDGDGVADPHNFHDASVSAANYLCSLERRNGPNPADFVLGYNNSSSYVADVIETSQRLTDTYQLPTVTVAAD